MAARILLHPRTAPLAAALAAGSVGMVVFSPRVVYAEAPDSASRKPIYDDYDAPPTSATLPSPTKDAAPPSTSIATAVSSFFESENASSAAEKEYGPTVTDRLAVEIRKARLFLYKHACTTEDAVNSAMDRAFDLEHSFTSTLASLAPSRESGEQLMPGAIYVLVAAMAGSIVARNRGILLRASAPLAIGIGAAWTVLPVTTRNVADLIWTYEQRFPPVAEAHVRMTESVERIWHTARAHSQMSVARVDEKIAETREAVEGWVRKGK